MNIPAGQSSWQSVAAPRSNQRWKLTLRGVAIGISALLIMCFSLSATVFHALSSHQNMNNNFLRNSDTFVRIDSTTITNANQTTAGEKEQLKILYVVTSMNEFDTGKRFTQKGFDRYQHTIIPVMQQSVQSIIAMNYSVDVVLIVDYFLKHPRRMLLRNALPSTNIEFWNSATPMGYKLEDAQWDPDLVNQTQPITRALARQHRFVIKDKLAMYDFFVCFEDDMIISGATVQHYITMERELHRMRQKAPNAPPRPIVRLPGRLVQENGMPFYGVLTKDQLKHMVPGFIRVEVLLEEDKYGAQEKLDPIPVTDRPQIDPLPCCGLSDQASAPSRPKIPKSDQLVLWETNIRALGIRKMPVSSELLDWVLMQRGPRYLEYDLFMGDYWSNRHEKYYQGERPDEKAFLYVNNQGGWMGTQRQIWEWHTELCSGGFLPPFDAPHFHLDGLDMRNVEYWSGGLQLFTREHGCNLQRIVSLHQDHFAKQLLYHSSNNKQRQLNKRRYQIVKVNDLFGQLNTVKKDAEATMKRILEQMQRYWAEAQKRQNENIID